MSDHPAGDNHHPNVDDLPAHIIWGGHQGNKADHDTGTARHHSHRTDGTPNYHHPQ